MAEVKGLWQGLVRDWVQFCRGTSLGLEALRGEPVGIWLARIIGERQIVDIGWAEIRDRVCNQFGLPPAAVLHRGRATEIVRVKQVMASLGRELSGLTGQELSNELHQNPAILSQGLEKAA